jgi:hypothetical protein
MQAAGLAAVTARYLDNASDAERRAATVREVLNSARPLHHSPQPADTDAGAAETER